jgi:parallel beta-helix repeat protein
MTKQLIIMCLSLLIIESSLNSQVWINEFLASNVGNLADPQYGVYSDWIELYNEGSTSINLSGWSLSDEETNNPTWHFPQNISIAPKSYLLVWADGQNTGLHTDFKLSADGESVVLYNSVGQLVDFLPFGSQNQDVSYGRKTDGSKDLGLFTTPTPGKSNNSSKFFTSAVEQVPVFSVNGGFFSKAIELDIKNLYNTGTIRFTSDGSDPSETSLIFSVPILINQTTVVKARMFYPNQIPGPIVTNTYFINEKFEQRKLPVLSLSTHPDYFYGKDSGLYVQNFKPEWEYPIHLEFYQNDGLLGFHHDAGVQVGGLNAWILPQKLLNIYSRKAYGSGKFNFQIFPRNKRNEFGDLILRCSGNDWSNTLFRDGLMQSLIHDYADLDAQDFRPTSVYINGKYLGIHNIREKQDADYCNYYHQINEDSLDYIENNTEVKEGNLNSYNSMVGLLSTGVQSDANFALLQSMMDTKNYTDYIISQIFSANTSWGHNVSCFKNRSGANQWRWLLHDYDRGFDLANVNSTGMNWATATNGQSYSNPAWATLFLRKMLENNNYKKAFISRFADHLYVSYHPVTIENKINYFANLIRSEMPYQIARWKGTTSSYGDAIPTLEFWENEVSQLKEYGIQRNAFMWTDLLNFFNLAGLSTLNLYISSTDAGTIKLHDFKIPTFPWKGTYLQKIELTLQANANPGFQFHHWEKIMTSAHSIFPLQSTWKYRDEALAPPADWNSPNYDDRNWTQGKAEFGYGDGDEATTLQYGNDPNNKTITYYFRQNFHIDTISNIVNLFFRFKADDGAVIYVNGKEIYRFNVPSQPTKIEFNTLASSNISGTAENEFRSIEIPKTTLQSGENLIAVEVHQVNPSSSDISFEGELLAEYVSSVTIAQYSPIYSLQLEKEASNLRAVFEIDGHCGILSENISTDTKLVKACSPYIATGNVLVKTGVKLSIEPGVEIKFPAACNLIINGHLDAQGSEKEPIIFSGLNDKTIWGGLFFQNSDSTNFLNFAQFTNASAGLDRTYQPAAISCYHADLSMDHLQLTNVMDNPIFSRFSNIVLRNSNIKSKVTGDCINVKQGFAIVENCEFEGSIEQDMDAIDYDGVKNGIVKNNIIHDFRGDNNDGLDIGEKCENLEIENNYIYHCFDKGISVGQQSTASLFDNTIVYTTIGIALKDQSKATIDHCTFFGNQQGVSAYEKNSGLLGGSGIITNCIVSNASSDAYRADTFSSLNFVDCLSDLDPGLPNRGDINENPEFVNPTYYNFQLKSGSPAIGKASDASNLGTRNVRPQSEIYQLLISEILYDDSLSNYPEYLEIYNPGNKDISLANYRISEGVEYVFETPAIIHAKEAIIITSDKIKFSQFQGQVFQWTDGKLKNEGERILLFDKDGILVDFVNFDNKAPWPPVNMLGGKSIELISANLDNHFGSNWKYSETTGGSPGSFTEISNADQVQNSSFKLRPQPASDWVELEFEHSVNDANCYVYNMLGVCCSAQKANGINLKINLIDKNFSDGNYLVQVIDKNGTSSSQLLSIVK